ncbi:MAG: hypothetical protein ABSG44_16505 [Thermodesulfobacteriota bacterium]|jgi:hypothetical protein
MAIGLDPKQSLLPEQLITSLLVSQDAVVRLLIEKGIFTKGEFLEKVNVVNLEIAKMA